VIVRSPRAETSRLLLALAAVAVGFSLQACSSAVPAMVREPRSGPVVLPAGGSSFFQFESTRVARHEGGEVAWEAEHPSAGPPVVGAVDLSSAWAAVGYERRLAFVQLSTRKVSWVPSPLVGRLSDLSIRGETALLRDGSRVLAIRVPSGSVLWEHEFASHLEQSEVNSLDYALPESDDEIVVLASRQGTAWTDGVVKVQRLDRSRGNWRVRNENRLPGFTWVHQAESDGAELYVAGLREETQRRVGGAGRLWQWLVISKVDLGSLEATELVYTVRQERETVVTDLVIGTGAVAVILDGRTLQVFRLVEGGTASAPIFERTFAKADSVAWISDQELVVQTANGTELVRY